MGYRTDIAKWCDCWNYDYLQIKLVAFELEFDLSKFELVQWMSNHPPWGIQFHYFISSCEIKWPALLKGTSTIIEMNPLYWCILQKLTLQGQYPCVYDCGLKYYLKKFLCKIYLELLQIGSLLFCYFSEPQTIHLSVFNAIIQWQD